MNSTWRTTTLDEILQRTEAVDPSKSPDSEFQYIDVSSISNQTFRIEETQRLKGRDAPSRARRLVRANDVLFATVRPTLRRIAIVPAHLDNQVCSTGYFVLRPKSMVDHRYIFYYLQSASFIAEMEALQKGASYPAVTDREVRSQEISFPPLREQERIVAILDEAFSGIATAKANTEKNIFKTRELFETTLEFAFSSSRKAWPIRTLGKLAGQITDGTHNSPPYVAQGVPMLDSKHIRNDFSIDNSEPDKFISVETDRQLAKRCKPREGDILISSRGSIGKIAIVREGQDFNIMGNMILIRLPPCINRSFAAFYLRSQVSHIESISRGVAQKGLYLSQIRAYDFPVPPESVQRQVGENLEAIAVETSRLDSLSRRKLASLETLKQSLLHQAYTGQL
jgi:type I restriction enzyme S subunit